jgi:lipopolysaccharide transport system permease protein
VYKIRYFWAYLARQDLLSRNRRSKLGMLWLMLQPLLMTAILAAVFGTVMHIPIREYAPYIFIGNLGWNLLSDSIIAGGGAFQSAGQYIRQFNHRVSIYSLRSAVVYTINFLIANIGMFIWAAIVFPRNLPIGFLTLPLTVLLLFIISWSITTIVAFVNVKYRDYQQVIGLIMQALWYFSPVFFQESMFQSNPWLYKLYTFNPITHLLFLQRKPLLQGIFPSGTDYLFTIVFAGILAGLAWLINRRYEKSVIFYL